MSIYNNLEEALRANHLTWNDIEAVTICQGKKDRVVTREVAAKLFKKGELVTTGMVDEGKGDNLHFYAYTKNIIYSI